MTASTAILTASMTQNEVRDKDKNQLENKTLGKLKAELVFRERQILMIEHAFASIRRFLAPIAIEESALGPIYQQIQDSLDTFEKELKHEAASCKKSDTKPLQTTHLLEITLQDIFNKKKTLEEKNQSITEFKDDNQGKEISAKLKELAKSRNHFFQMPNQKQSENQSAPLTLRK